MYITGYYKSSGGSLELGDNSFRTFKEAAERLEDIFENTTGKDINFSNIASTGVDVIGELYQYTVSNNDEDSVIIKFYTREKNKGYIYNTFTDFQLKYTFFIKKTPPYVKIISENAQFINIDTKNAKKQEQLASNYINPFTVLPDCDLGDVKTQLIEELKLKFKAGHPKMDYDTEDCSLDLEKLSIDDNKWSYDKSYDNSDYINKYLRKRRKRIRPRTKRTGNVY